ncbi:MAG TPA: hypothetical protein GX738_01145 [Firmicutes bacterium]|nr:hypothetical protein [Bacillota bacterium]
MILFYVILVICIVLLAWRINHPGDLRLNRRYLARFLKDSEGRGPVRILTRRLPVDKPVGAPEERVYYHLDTEFADSSKRSVLVQIVYPLEELHEERERRNRPGNEDANLMQGMSSPLQSSSDVGVKLQEDPFKDLAQEEKVKAAKVALVNREIDHLRMLSIYCKVFPRLISHDEQRLITVTEAVGAERLDDIWQEADGLSRKNLLTQLVQDLAVLHSRGKDLASLLPPGPSLNEPSMRETLSGALVNGLQVAYATVQQVQREASPLYGVAQLDKGIRLANASPRGFFILDGQGRSCHWAGLRRDVSALDVVELICDPALGLAAEEEVELLATYLDRLEQDGDSESELPTLTQLRRLVIYFQLVLIGHLALFQREGRATSSNNPLGIKHWPATSLAHVAGKVLIHLQADEELATLRDLLVPVLQPLTK